MDFGYSFAYDEDAIIGLLSGLFGAFRLPSSLLSIATYVLTALALYTLAKRRGLNKPWLAWIPVVNCWLLGSLSDQYRYVVKGENKSKRKVLLILSIINLLLVLMMAVLTVVMIVQLFLSTGVHTTEKQILDMVIGPVIGLIGLCIPMLGVGIAYIVIRYMALYDVYKSMDPSNSVLFLVLSILASVTEPFFLFFNREKDLGMPPRRQSPEYAPPQPDPVYETPEPEPWESGNKDYL